MIKESIKVFYWHKIPKKTEHMKRFRKHCRVFVHRYNYIPLFTDNVSVFNLNSQKNITDYVFRVLGEGNFLLKGFRLSDPKKRADVNKVNSTNKSLCEVSLKSVGEKYSVDKFKVYGLRYYWFWKKTEQEINSILERWFVHERKNKNSI